MTLITPVLEDLPARATVPVFAAIVTDDLDVVMDEGFDTASARRDAIVALLTENHDEVDQEEIEEILAPFGGANADVAVGEIAALFAERGAPVTISLTDTTQDVGPSVIYTVFTDYGTGDTFIVHYGSREDRLVELRQRAFDLSADYAAEFFETADEETCRRIIEAALIRTGGRVFVVEAIRHDVGEVYSGSVEVVETR